MSQARTLALPLARPAALTGKGVGVSSGTRDPIAFTSAQDGNWTDLDTWGETDYPRLAGDTVSMGHNVTLESSTTVECGAITMTAAKTFALNGSLIMAGDITRATGSTLAVGAGATISMGENNIAGNVTGNITFSGSPGSRITVQSAGGAFTGNVNGILGSYSYVDFTGLGNSYLSRSHNIARNVPYSHCTFTDCGTLDLELLNGGTNAGFSVTNCDFRDCGKVTIYLSNDTIGTATRLFDSNTLENTNIWFRCEAHTVTNSVFSGCQIETQRIAGATTSVWSGNFYAKSSGNFTPSIYGLGTRTDEYWWYDGGDHPLTPTGTADISGCVFDGTDSGIGTNWFLWGASASVNFIVDNNIFLGKGNIFAFTGNAAPTLTFQRNTIRINNNGELSSGIALAPILLTEQSANPGLTGTVAVKDNLIVVPSGASTVDDYIDLLVNTSDQIDTLDYNYFWDEDAGSLTPSLMYATNVVVTTGIETNGGSVNPGLAASTRNLKTWDSSLGGDGTAASAIAEMLKLNGYGGATFDANYAVADLLDWVKAGFVPSNATLSTAASDGGYVGAFDVP